MNGEAFGTGLSFELSMSFLSRSHASSWCNSQMKRNRRYGSLYSFTYQTSEHELRLKLAEHFHTLRNAMYCDSFCFQSKPL